MCFVIIKTLNKWRVFWANTVRPTEIRREIQTRVSFELCQTREVRVWQPKREIHQACVSEALLSKRQREVHALCQRHETRASIRGTQQPCVSQASLSRCDNQQHESCVSSQQRRQTRVLEPRCKSCVHEPRVSEPCVPAARSKDTSRQLKSPRQYEAISSIPLPRI